ncbi:hypothetical protein [Enterobacter cloacae complex sp. 357B1]|uniref:hypothetical protein n=1 Tax=Enterobacter cloacae complex sp. 357B1 TaxID=3395827 RepID=UPI003CF1E181
MNADLAKLDEGYKANREKLVKSLTADEDKAREDKAKKDEAAARKAKAAQDKIDEDEEEQSHHENKPYHRLVLTKLRYVLLVLTMNKMKLKNVSVQQVN